MGQIEDLCYRCHLESSLGHFGDGSGIPLSPTLHGLLLRRLWIPLMFWILPITREVNTLDHRSHTRFSIEEAESAGPLSPLPYAFHGRLEASGLHLSLALGHGDILAVEGDVLNAFLVVSLHQIGNH